MSWERNFICKKCRTDRNPAAAESSESEEADADSWPLAGEINAAVGYLHAVEAIIGYQQIAVQIGILRQGGQLGGGRDGT